MSISNTVYKSKLSKKVNYSSNDELIVKAKAGCKKSYNEFMRNNLRFVCMVAKHFEMRGVDYDDLIQVGNIGLIKAYENYDITRGFKFSTYAVNWIKCYILREIRKNGHLIRIPWSAPEEIKKGQQVISINSHVGGDSNKLMIADFIPSNENLEHDEEVKSLNRALVKYISNLSKREQYVINNRFGLEGNHQLSLTTIGGNLGVCRERVRQIEDAAILKLRKLMRESVE
jgi:RNA polymerase primary sigma factor